MTVGTDPVGQVIDEPSAACTTSGAVPVAAGSSGGRNAPRQPGGPASGAAPRRWRLPALSSAAGDKQDGGQPSAQDGGQPSAQPGGIWSWEDSVPLRARRR